MLHTIKVDDVIPMLSPAVGWVAATLVGMFPKYVLMEHFVSELCLMVGGTKLWLNGLHSLVLIMLYGLMTGLFCSLWVYISESHESYWTLSTTSQ